MKPHPAIPMLLLLLAGASSPTAIVLPTGPPVLLTGDYGYLILRPEAQYREATRDHVQEEGFVPLKAGPTGLSSHALFDSILVAGRTVTLAVDGDPTAGYRLFADLDADGDLAKENPWVMKQGSAELWDFTGVRQTKEAYVADVETEVPQDPVSQDSRVPLRFRVILTEDLVQIPGEPRPTRQAVLAQSTLREGIVKSGGKAIRFALAGVGGVYGDDFNSVLFDLDGDGKLDPENRASSEYFWVWERNVNLNGRSYGFSVDRYGSRLTLTPLRRKLPDRPSLEVGHPAPDFAFTDLEGRRHRLKDYRGKVVLLDFWGIWCPACVENMKALAEAYRRLHDEGFEILGVHEGGHEPEVRKFIDEHGMAWPETLEAGKMPEGRPLQRLYRFFGAPNYFLIGRDGRLLTTGPHKPADLIRIAEQQLD